MPDSAQIIAAMRAQPFAPGGPELIATGLLDPADHHPPIGREEVLRIPAVPDVEVAEFGGQRARLVRPHMPIIGLAVRVAMPGPAVSFPLLDHAARMASGGMGVPAENDPVYWRPTKGAHSSSVQYGRCMIDPTELELRESLLEKRERELREREARLIDNVTMQAITLVLLKHHRSKGTIKPAALNEIRTAVTQFGAGDYDPKAQLRRILDETVMDREQRRETPR